MTDKTEEPLHFIYELSTGQLVFFPASVGKGVGYDIARATPIAHPRWKIEVHHENRVFTGIKVHQDHVRLALLKLPRCRHA